jgi:hypothetical protein
MGSSTKERRLVMVSELQNGDTVEVNGSLETVSWKHIKRGFTGVTYKGDPHNSGIIKVIFKKE